MLHLACGPRANVLRLNHDSTRRNCHDLISSTGPAGKRVDVLVDLRVIALFAAARARDA